MLRRRRRPPGRRGPDPAGARPVASTRAPTFDPDLPLASFATALRLRHAAHLEPLGRLRDASGPFDRDVITIAVAVLGVRRDAGGRLDLRRPDVAASVTRAVRWLAEAGVDPVPGIPAAIASVLHREHELGRLAPNVDPPAALVEPLHARHGVAPVSDEHVCQCFAPHDRCLRGGHRLLQLWTGHLVHARCPEPIDAVLAGKAREAFFDLLRLGREAPGEDDVPCLLGSVGGPRSVGPLWVFGDRARPGRYDNLFLSEEGTPYVSQPDRRYRDGYRWKEETSSFVFSRWSPAHSTAPTGIA